MAVLFRAALLAVFALPVAAFAQGPAKPSCATCKDRGMVACRLCASKPCTSHAGYAFCSVEADCGDCGGARWRKCGQCDHAPEIDLPRKRADLAAWVATKKPLTDYMVRRDVLFIDSKHFQLVYDLKKLDLKGASSPHEAAHAYADRLERLHTDFRADAGVEEEQFTGVTQVMIWSSEKDQERASSKYTLEKSTTLAKLMGKSPVVSLAFGKGDVRDDDGLYHAVVHQVAHCLLSNIYDGVWIGGGKGGWMDEGLAHLYETRYFGEARVWCSMSDEARSKLEFKRFESEVLARVADGAVIELAALSGLATAGLSPEQRLFAWSYCDYLVRQHGGSLAKVAKLLKKEKPTSEAIGTGLGVPIADFQLAWRRWVEATYSAKRK
jgi:hypothetical protein